MHLKKVSGPIFWLSSIGTNFLFLWSNQVDFGMDIIPGWDHDKAEMLRRIPWFAALGIVSVFTVFSGQERKEN